MLLGGGGSSDCDGGACLRGRLPVTMPLDLLSTRLITKSRPSAMRVHNMHSPNEPRPMTRWRRPLMLCVVRLTKAVRSRDGRAIRLRLVTGTVTSAWKKIFGEKMSPDFFFGEQCFADKNSRRKQIRQQKQTNLDYVMRTNFLQTSCHDRNDNNPS